MQMLMAVLLSFSLWHTQDFYYVLEFMFLANWVYTVKAFEPCSVTTPLYRLNIVKPYAVKSIKIPEESKIQ